MVVSLPFFSFFSSTFPFPFLFSFLSFFFFHGRRNGLKWKRSVHGDSHEFYSVIMYRQKRPLWEWLLRLPFARTLSESAFQSRDSLESHCHLPKLPSRRWCRLRKRYLAALSNKQWRNVFRLSSRILETMFGLKDGWKWFRAKFIINHSCHLSEEYLDH